MIAKSPAAGRLARMGLVPMALCSAVRLTPQGCLAAESVQLAMYAPPTNYTVPGEEVELKQVVLLLRHGDRAPIARRAGSLVCSEDAWAARLPAAEEIAAWNESHPVHGPAVPSDDREEPFGQLTSVGAQQTEALGIALRLSLERHAPHLLPTTAAHVAAHATNIRRTQQSLQNLLRGLGDVSVPISVRRLDEERLIPRPEVCPALRARMDALGAARERATSTAAENATLAATAAAMGYEGALRLDQAREVLTCYLSHGDPLPGALVDTDVAALLSINARQCESRARLAADRPGRPRTPSAAISSHQQPLRSH